MEPFDNLQSKELLDDPDSIYQPEMSKNERLDHYYNVMDERIQLASTTRMQKDLSVMKCYVQEQDDRRMS